MALVATWRPMASDSSRSAAPRKRSPMRPWSQRTGPRRQGQAGQTTAA